MGSKTDIYVCVTKCYYKDKLWDPAGKKLEERVLVVGAGEVVDCKHFVKKEENSVEVKEAQDYTMAPSPRPMSQGSQIVNRGQRQVLIIDSIKRLDPVVDYWHGKPKVSSIERDLNMNITKEERDLAVGKIEKMG